MFFPARWALLSAAAVGASAFGDAPPAKPAGPPTAAAVEYKTCLSSYTRTREEYSKAAAARKSKNDPVPVAFISPEKYAPFFLAVARKYPADPAALDALLWVAQNAYSAPEVGPALQGLAKDHLRSDKLGSALGLLPYSYSDDVEPFLQAAIKGSPHRDVQGRACLALARWLLQKAGRAEMLRDDSEPAKRLKEVLSAEQLESLAAVDPGALKHQAEGLFERVVRDYADVKTGRNLLGKVAEGDLYELHYLVVGKPAPEIEGPDLNGKHFKLSDYRGKVVLLDFWGNW